MKSLFALLSYQAFRPDPCDVEYPLSERFRLRKLNRQNRCLVCSVGKQTWRAVLATFGKDGAATFSEPKTGPNSSAAADVAQWLRDLAKVHDTAHVALGIGHGWRPSVLQGVTRHNDIDLRRIIREAPGRFFGDRKIPEKETAVVTNHPTMEGQAMEFRINTEEIDKARAIVDEAGLILVRVVCEPAQMLELAYATEPGLMEEAGSLLLAGPSQYLLLELNQGAWGKTPNFDPQIDSESIDNLIELTGHLTPQQTVVYLDGGLNSFDDALQRMVHTTNTAVLGKTRDGSFRAITHN